MCLDDPASSAFLSEVDNVVMNDGALSFFVMFFHVKTHQNNADVTSHHIVSPDDPYASDATDVTPTPEVRFSCCLSCFFKKLTNLPPLIF